MVRDKVGQVWAVAVFSIGVAGAAHALVLVVDSREMHLVLVLDGGRTGWKDGSLHSLGELAESEWAGTRRIA